MNSTRQRMFELLAIGYQCSQIVMIMGLESRGQTNPELVRAMAGLAGGCGEGSCTCGCLTGACCFLSLLSNKGSSVLEQQSQRVKLSTELVRWFWQKYGFPLGGIDCMAICDAGGPGASSELCQQIMDNVYQKVLEITLVNKMDINWEDLNAN